ncbi:NO-binding membrane sensor protein with MHYT domain [Stackebrandtia endophytica]|uniref:NO-binding membrane sensor protein with MHYT domain n=1 Tax=Stackebrandtia endophytica TaxID=1496996 RepID=A0A543AU23_9ACTN|nr:MHYT domain-containing protein [Stackebrandtia endophytica]TQL76016.1 NO-binding membrane sensor protein with MHYT domain [Stackebrandtia endophytica]
MTHAHFAYGWVNPLMGLGFALAGSYLGLSCMVQARTLPPGRARLKWLVFGSLAIGGIGIWMMHFIAMIGFSVTGSSVRYDLAITAASLVISVMSVVFGLFVIGLGDPSITKIAVGGPLTGAGVVAMHYTGMAAVNLSGTISYDSTWVIASIVIAVVAATVALFFTTWVTGRGSLIIASVIMAIAVCGMHYTGMGSISVTLRNRGLDPVPGVDPLLLLIPILLLATVVLITLIVGVLGGRDDTDPTASELALSTVRRPATASIRKRTDTSETQESGFWGTDNEQSGDSSAAGRHLASAAARMRDRPNLPRPRGESRERTDWNSADWDSHRDPRL